MANDTLRYDEMVENALRGVVRDALSHAMSHGLPGEHHFYVTFHTQAPGVSVPEFLVDQYPEEMTIVLQHQYWNLKVDDAGFSVTLSFSNRPAELVIPFSALSAFVDPSVKFGLQFNVEDSESTERSGVPALRETGELVRVPDNQQDPQEELAGSADNESDDDTPASAEVVSLDTFRKK